MNAHHWDGSRYMQAPRPLYESYFIRANHPTKPQAFWIRYTLFLQSGETPSAGG